jgi:hypothetical protein
MKTRSYHYAVSQDRLPEYDTNLAQWALLVRCLACYRLCKPMIAKTNQ